MTESIELAHLFRKEYQPRRLRATSAKNTRLFFISFNSYGDFLKRPPTTADLDDDQIQDWLYSFVESGRSAFTANCYRNKVVALWTFLAKRRIVDTFPTVEKMKEPRKIPRAWTPEQLTTLFKACSEVSGEMAGIPGSLWWHAIHAVIWDTGERISAVLSLSWDDLAWDTGFIVSRAENRKGGKADKAFKLHPDTLLILRKLRSVNSRDILFPTDCHFATIYNRYARILQRAGLPFDRKHKFHCLRRSVASYFEAAGGDATKLLGHSGRGVTEKSYLDPTICDTKHASDLLYRPFPAKSQEGGAR